MLTPGQNDYKNNLFSGHSLFKTGNPKVKITLLKMIKITLFFLSVKPENLKCPTLRDIQKGNEET